MGRSRDGERVAPLGHVAGTAMLAGSKSSALQAKDPDRKSCSPPSSEAISVTAGTRRCTSRSSDTLGKFAPSHTFTTHSLVYWEILRGWVATARVRATMRMPKHQARVVQMSQLTGCWVNRSPDRVDNGRHRLVAGRPAQGSGPRDAGPPTVRLSV